MNQNTMIAKILMSIFCMFLFISTVLAQQPVAKTDFEKLVDINSRVTEDYIKQFALEKNLNVPKFESQEDIEKQLNKYNYENFKYSDISSISKGLLDEFFVKNSLYLNDPLLVKYVASVGKLLAANLPNQQGITYTFGIIDSPDIKIYTFPGGYIFLTKGFLKSLTNEAQLAACLSREIVSLNDNILVGGLFNDNEIFSYYTSLKSIYRNNIQVKESIQDNSSIVNQVFSDPFATLDYYGSPSIEHNFLNKNFVGKKLLSRLIDYIPTIDSITSKDLEAIKNLSVAGYDPVGLKEMINNINRSKNQASVIDRTIKIENWLTDKSISKRNNNKLEGRYYMMVERLKY